jgi:phenol 2-monooxygenase
MQLGHAQRADGRWRVFAFGADDPATLLDLAEWLGTSEESPVRRHTPSGADVDSVLDVHAVFRCGPHDLDLSRVPAILLPHSGPLGLQDWEKAWARDARADVFALRGVSADGAVVVVRPDQYVAAVLPLTARAELTAFFAGFLTVQPIPALP